MKTFIVIPVLNEEKTISAVLSELLDHDYENIVIVDDGSTDETASIVKGFPVHYLEQIVNLGQGAALQTGNEYAISQGADIIVHFDGDGQHSVDDIARFEEIINQGVDVTLGSRFLSSTQQIPFTKKYFILKPAIVVNWIFTGLKLTDAHNGFRALSQHAAKSLKVPSGNSTFRKLSAQAPKKRSA